MGLNVEAGMSGLVIGSAAGSTGSSVLRVEWEDGCGVEGGL